MRKLIIGAVLACMFAVPGIASANTGSVTCDSRGVVFSYNANFSNATTVTETVSGVDRVIIVPRYQAFTDIVPMGKFGVGVAGQVIVSASWVGGSSIPPTIVTCPYVQPPVPPTPPAPPVLNCSPGTTEVSRVTDGNNTTVLCERTVIPPVPPTPPPAPMPLCRKGYKNLGVKNGILVCERTKIKIVSHTKIKWKIKLVEWCPKPPKPTPPGVLG